MSLSIERYGDVTRIRMASLGSAALHLDVSAYVIRGIVIDSGFHHARSRFLGAIDAMGIHGCVVTHWHEDHAGNATQLARRGIPVLLRSDTEEIVRSGPNIAMYRRVTWGRPPALDVPLASLDLAGLECIDTPGHSRDHQVVWDPTTGTLFSGDLWLGIRARNVHSSENPREIIESLRRAAALQPVRMFDAHRGLVEPAVDAIERRIEWLSETLSTIEKHIAEGWDDAVIVKHVFGGETIAGILTRGDYATRNFVRSVRRNSDRYTVG
jgi:glyoxylase-like metal-dependent hydrolase (beta-lactamase superfamily II)